MFREILKVRCRKNLIFPIIVLLLFILSYILISLNLGVFNLILLLIIIGIFILIIVCYLLEINKQHNELHKSLSGFKDQLLRYLLGITITGLIITGMVLIALYFHPPPQIVTIVEPKKLDAAISAGDKQAGGILIKNLGSSPENITVAFKNESWVNMTVYNESLITQQGEDFTIGAGEVKTINYNISVSLYAIVGNYTKIIQIKNSNNDIAEIPILINVLPPAQFQATIDVPDEVNQTKLYFKVKVYIKNLGASPIYGVNLSLNLSNPPLSIEGEEEMNNPMIPVGANVSREWWVNVTDVTNITNRWQTVRVNINSSNAGNQTLFTKIKLTPPNLPEVLNT